MNQRDRRSITSPANGLTGGVKSPEGKSVSSRNAIKHGIFVRYSTSFDDASFEEIYTGFASEFGDETSIRSELICQLAVLAIRLRRCARFEADFLREKLNPPKFERKLIRKGFDFDISSDEFEEVLIHPGEPMVLDPAILAELELVYKYEAQFVSRFCAIVHVLTRGEK